MPEADLARPPEQRRERHPDDREDQHERQQEVVAVRVEVRQPGPDDRDEQRTGGQPQRLPPHEALVAKGDRHARDGHFFCNGAGELERLSDRLPSHQDDQQREQEDDEFRVGGARRLCGDELAHHSEQETARQRTRHGHERAERCCPEGDHQQVRPERRDVEARLRRRLEHRGDGRETPRQTPM